MKKKHTDSSQTPRYVLKRFELVKTLVRTSPFPNNLCYLPTYVLRYIYSPTEHSLQSLNALIITKRQLLSKWTDKKKTTGYYETIMCYLSNFGSKTQHAKQHITLTPCVCIYLICSLKLHFNMANSSFSVRDPRLARRKNFALSHVPNASYFVNCTNVKQFSRASKKIYALFTCLRDCKFVSK